MDNEGIRCSPVDRCDCCGGPGRVLHAAIRDRLFGAPGEWSIRRCDDASCGLGWLDPRPETTDLPKLYATYYTHVDRDAPDSLVVEEPVEIEEGVDPGPGGRKALILNLLAKLMPWRRVQFRSGLCYLEDMPPGDLLEVGCGDGNFLVRMQRAGWRAIGLDFDDAAVAAARRHPGIDIRQGDLIGSAFPDASFDAIVMNNVIEHLPDTAEVMAECRRILRPGGRAVMVTPNLDSPGCGTFGADWRGLEVPRHLFLFTTRTLKRFARAAGFARVQAFSPIGGGGADGIVAMSQVIAERSGRTPPAADPRAMRRYARLATLMGVDRGEWVVLVATR